MTRTMAKTQETQWLRVAPLALARWTKLTIDDLRDVRGNMERLITLLQDRYGFHRDDALGELKAWRDSLALSR
jgi:hypothetical protein